MEPNTGTVVINVPDEKSIFERAIIEAFKQQTSNEIFERLTIANDEIKQLKNEITKTKTFLINVNIVDKLARLAERKFFNVNLQVGRIYDSLLDSKFFDLLNSDTTLLITLSNNVLNLLELIKSTLIGRQLEKKCSIFLNFLLNRQNIHEEQKQTISELLQSFPTRNSSNVYKNYDEILTNAVVSAKSSSLDDKIDGLNQIMESFGNTYSLEEQFDLLIEKIPTLIKAIIHQPNPDCKDVYFLLGNFLCSMLFATKFKINAHMPDYRLKKSDLTSNFFFLINNDQIVEENNKEQISFLHDIVFELTAQKDLLVNCENIINICTLVINTLTMYETMFNLLYVSYLIMKRIYFTFPQFRRHIEDSLAMVLADICQFKEPAEKQSSYECVEFMKFLLTDEGTSKELKDKINKRLESKNIELDLESYNSTEVEIEALKFNDFNLRIGYPSSFEVEAGGQTSKYIEVYNPNSLIYIGFATHSNDISFELLKYMNKNIMMNNQRNNFNYDDDDEDSLYDKENFESILRLERIESSVSPIKFVIFVKDPGTYKIVWDNSYSWFTGKTIRYRVSVMKPLSDLDINRRVDFELLKRNMSRDQHKKNEDRLTEMSLLNEEKPEDKKILMLMYETKERVFYPTQMQKKEELVKLYPKDDTIQLKDTYISIPILLTNGKLRVYDPENVYELDTVTNTEENEKALRFVRSETSSEFVEAELEKDSLSNFFDDCLNSKIFSKIKNFKTKTIFLNFLILEKQPPSTESVISVDVHSETYKQVVSKLGFYPTEFLKSFPNVKLFSMNFADAGLMQQLYCKINLNESLNNMIHIHFDKLTAQASMFYESAVSDKLPGFKYDAKKNLMDNLDKIVEFINNFIVLLGHFEFSLSYSDIEDNIFDTFFKNLSTKINYEDRENPVTLSRVENNRTKLLMNNIHLFYVKD